MHSLTVTVGLASLHGDHQFGVEMDKKPEPKKFPAKYCDGYVEETLCQPIEVMRLPKKINKKEKPCGD